MKNKKYVLFLGGMTSEVGRTQVPAEVTGAEIIRAKNKGIAGVGGNEFEAYKDIEVMNMDQMRLIGQIPDDHSDKYDHVMLMGPKIADFFRLDNFSSAGAEKYAKEHKIDMSTPEGEWKMIQHFITDTDKAQMAFSADPKKKLVPDTLAANFLYKLEIMLGKLREKYPDHEILFEGTGHSWILDAIIFSLMKDEKPELTLNQFWKIIQTNEGFSIKVDKNGDGELTYGDRGLASPISIDIA